MRPTAMHAAHGAGTGRGGGIGLIYVKNTASQGSANGSASGRPEAPKFGQLAGRSVVNTPSDYHPFSFYSLKPALGSCHSFLAPLCGRGCQGLSSRAG